MGALFIPMFLVGVVLMVKNPVLLYKRLQAKEQTKGQAGLIALAGLVFIAGFIVSGLTFRFAWLSFPKEVPPIAVLFFLFFYGLYAEVLRENTFLSRRIEVQEGQTVVDSGLYSLVRHPMYSASIFLFLMLPLILGSVYAFVVFLVYPVIIVKRIKREEAFLEKNLPGYRAYQEKVRYRLIPFIW